MLLTWARSTTWGLTGYRSDTARLLEHFRGEGEILTRKPPEWASGSRSTAETRALSPIDSREPRVAAEPEGSRGGSPGGVRGPATGSRSTAETKAHDRIDSREPRVAVEPEGSRGGSPGGV
jgi:hypothetical protein